MCAQVISMSTTKNVTIVPHTEIPLDKNNCPGCKLLYNLAHCVHGNPQNITCRQYENLKVS